MDCPRTQAAAQNHYDKTQDSLSISSVLTMDRDLSETNMGYDNSDCFKCYNSANFTTVNNGIFNSTVCHH